MSIKNTINLKPINIVPDPIKVELNQFTIRIYCDEFGRESGFSDDIQLEIATGNESCGYKMNLSEAKQLLKQLNFAIKIQSEFEKRS